LRSNTSGAFSAEANPAPPFRVLTAAMRWLLGVAAVLVMLAGTQLFVFAERTNEFFAWTITNPLTAATLGAAYWGSFVIETLAAREKLWANARIAVPTVLLFTLLTLGVTLGHLNLFHLGPAFAVNTRVVTWAWIAIYVAVPVLLAVVSVVQTRRPGPDPARAAPLSTWLYVLIGGHAAVLLPLGAWLLVDPSGGASSFWPWPLPPLAGRAIGAWMLSLGVAAVHAMIERDRRRLRPAAWGYLAIAVLEFAALARYPDVPDWNGPRAACYSAFLLSMLAAGIAALYPRDRGGSAVERARR
jgi:hypothetical protein